MTTTETFSLYTAAPLVRSRFPFKITGVRGCNATPRFARSIYRELRQTYGLSALEARCIVVRSFNAFASDSRI